MGTFARGCLLAACVLVGLLGLGVGLCGAIISGSGLGGGLLLIGIVIVIAATAGFVALARASGGPPATLRLAVYRSGRITADGRDVLPAQVPTLLAGLRRRSGVVWLYREGAAEERHPNSALVARAIAEARLPVSLTSRPDFADVLSGDGTTRPR